MASAQSSSFASNICTDAPPFLAFLASAKEAVKSFAATPTTRDSAAVLPHVYFGNEAADADSLVSSLCYAYLQSELSARDEASSSTSSETAAAYAHVPLLSITRADLKLRPEVAFMHLIDLTPTSDLQLLEHSLSLIVVLSSFFYFSHFYYYKHYRQNWL